MQTKPTKSRNVPSVKEIGAKYLRECFYFEEQTGRLFWRTRPREHFPSDSQWLTFNNRFAGKRAGKIEPSGHTSIRITCGDTSHLIKGHYVVWAMAEKEFVEGHQFKFINGIPFDIRICNLSHVQRPNAIPTQEVDAPGLSLREDGKWEVSGATGDVYESRNDAVTARTRLEYETYATSSPLTPFQEEWQPACKSVNDISIGDQFGDWEVVGERVRDRPGSFKRSCLCHKCDTVSEVYEATLVNGNSTGCGECRYWKRTENTCYVGVKVGPWTVAEVVDCTRENYTVRVKCDCGFSQVVDRAFVHPQRYRVCPECVSADSQQVLYMDHWRRILESASERGIPVEMTWEDAKDILDAQDWKCALSGIPLTFAASMAEHEANPTLTNASFDRRSSDGVYDKTNCQWIAKRLNFIKGPVPEDEFIRWCLLVAEKHKTTVTSSVNMQVASGLTLKSASRAMRLSNETAAPVAV